MGRADEWGHGGSGWMRRRRRGWSGEMGGCGACTEGAGCQADGVMWDRKDETWVSFRLQQDVGGA